MKKLTLITLVSTVTLAAILFSCSGDDAVTPAPSNLVSGIFIGTPLVINDTTLLQVDLSLDELADGSVNGGLWLTYLYDRHPASRERVQHQLVFTPSADGQTVLFTGMASITNPPGELLISGTITGGENITAKVTLPDGKSVSPVMYWTGPYLRPNTTKALTTDASDYVGTYPAVWGSCDGDCYGGLPLYNGQLVVSEASVNNVGTIDFKGKAIGWYSGCCNGSYHAGDTLSASLPRDNDADEAEIRGGTLELTFILDERIWENVWSLGNFDPSQPSMITNSITLMGNPWVMETFYSQGTIGPKTTGK